MMGRLAPEEEQNGGGLMEVHEEYAKGRLRRNGAGAFAAISVGELLRGRDSAV